MATEEIISTTAAVSVSDKPFKFEDSNFKCWQAKKNVFLNSKNISHVLTEDIPVSPSGSNELNNGKTIVESDGTSKTYDLDSVANAKVATDNLQLRKVIALRQENDYLCKNHILNNLADDLYDYYTNYKTAKRYGRLC